MKELSRIKGQNGILIVYEECIAISRKTFGGFISQGGYSGEKRYFYKDISSIEYKKPTFIANGFFKILTPGSVETNKKVGIFSSVKIAKDQNTIVLRPFSKEVGNRSDKIYNLVMKKILEAKSDKPMMIKKSSKMDELKKLADLKTQGVLTEQEFQKEKEKLLNS